MKAGYKLACVLLSWSEREDCSGKHMENYVELVVFFMHIAYIKSRENSKLPSALGSSEIIVIATINTNRTV